MFSLTVPHPLKGWDLVPQPTRGKNGRGRRHKPNSYGKKAETIFMLGIATISMRAEFRG